MLRQSWDESVRFVLGKFVEDELLGAVEGAACETVARLSVPRVLKASLSRFVENVSSSVRLARRPSLMG